jgi:hypothetical protein
MLPVGRLGTCKSPNTHRNELDARIHASVWESVRSRSQVVDSKDREMSEWLSAFAASSALRESSPLRRDIPP